MVVDAGSEMPAVFSTEIVSGVSGAVPGHTKSILVGDAYSTVTYSPFALTRVPPSSVTVPEGFDTGVPTEASQRPARLATDPGLQAGSAQLAPLKIPVMTGFPESTMIARTLVEEAAAELVAVRVME
jgi:hypothetical protein